MGDRQLVSIWDEKGQQVFERITNRQPNLNSAQEMRATHPSSLFETLSTISLFLFFVIAVGFLSTFLSSTAKAQSAALANDPAMLAASADESGSAKAFAYSGQLLFETARTADEAAPESFTGWYQLTASATHKKTSLTGTLRAGYVREYSYQRDDGDDGAFDNPTLSVAKSYLNERDFNLSWVDSVSISVNGAIGANRESARRRLLWANGLAVTGTKSLGRFTVRQSFGYTHSFFDYDVRDDGTVNSPDSLKSVTLLVYEFTPKLSISGMFTYGLAQSFRGVSRGSQLSAAEFSYSLTDKISMGLGVASERSTLEPDGQTDRIRFYAPQAAQYYFDLVVLL